MLHAIKCPRCGLLCDQGDYGTRPFANTGYHFAIESDGFAIPAEGPSDRLQEQGAELEIKPCDGSECMGMVVNAETGEPEPCVSPDALRLACLLAFDWHGGGGSPLYSFASTRTIHDEKHRRGLLAEIKKCKKDATHLDRKELEHIEYVVTQLPIGHELCTYEEVFAESSYEVTLKKDYIGYGFDEEGCKHDEPSEDKQLIGTMEVQANSQTHAELLVERMMHPAEGEKTLQTIDPRIEWDEDFMEGEDDDDIDWEYVDFSFEVVPADERVTW